LRSRIRRTGLRRTLAATLLGIGLACGVVRASTPSVADLDAAARAVGNRRDIAVRIGQAVFGTRWPAEVSQISANELNGHLIVGIRIWGVKFHQPITREQFVSEVITLIERSFATAPTTEEIDAWASVPITVGKGVIVSGDLAKPTSRTVFSLSVRRGETPASIQARAAQTNDGVFWDDDWARTAFAEAH
jgi:hypothetical protein